MSTEHVIQAAVFCQPDEGPVDSARRIAGATLAALANAKTVSIAMNGVPGASSSFFNVLFAELAAVLGASEAGQRVKFRGLGKTLTDIANRSRTAVLGS